MVKVTYNYQNTAIKEVTIIGHANFSEIGNDIVCAGISAIVIGALNALHELETNQIQVINSTTGLVKLKVINITNNSQIILKTMLWQLKTIKKQYPKYINIKEV
ncbi:ribosomal-processing cysteine protease Prp [Spiroplasma endosymbiont of Polydrusus pterygomalis]|uniref:ribosomal-processing cysteine protease Prp n=1 Tax=Spiroplasma endosymbiont of Polydrusus pterygomalis TaxID=3139327 RepID=UPI003CCA82D9